MTRSTDISNSTSTSTPPKHGLSNTPAYTPDVPDSEIDLTDLWEEVRMAKSKKDSEKGSNKGTVAYDDVLYRLGIDIMEGLGHLTKPGDIFDKYMDDYDNIRTNEQLMIARSVISTLNFSPSG